MPPAEVSWRDTRFAGPGLRTRFRPRSRILPLLFTLAPWINVLLLVVAFLFAVAGGTLPNGTPIHGDAIVPGVRVDLPSAPFRDGAASSMLLVVNPLQGHPAADAAGPNVLVFFDESRYNLSREHVRQEFANAVARHLEGSGDRDAILFIDRRVPYGDVAAILVLLREAGVSQINFAMKAP